MAYNHNYKISTELLDRLLKLTDPYPSPGRFWLGPRLMVFVKDPDQLQVRNHRALKI